MPGMLAPGDIPKIAAHENVQGGDELGWVQTHFQASDGAKALVQGEVIAIPTIVPRLTATGCIFLDEKGSCTIHAVAPFGCRMFNMCDDKGAKTDQDDRSAKALACISGDHSYMMLWQMLHIEGCEAPPAIQRRTNLQQEIDMIEKEDRADDD